MIQRGCGPMPESNVIPFPSRPKPTRRISFEVWVDDDWAIRSYRTHDIKPNELGAASLALHRLAAMVAESYRACGNCGALDEPIFSALILRSSDFFTWFEQDEFQRVEDLQWLKERWLAAFKSVQPSSSVEPGASGPT